MFFRCRIYEVLPDRLPVFHELFEKYLLPIQARHGATLVARIASTVKDRLVALWLYNSADHMAEVQAAVAADIDLKRRFTFREAPRAHVSPSRAASVAPFPSRIAARKVWCIPPHQVHDVPAVGYLKSLKTLTRLPRHDHNSIVDVE